MKTTKEIIIGDWNPKQLSQKWFSEEELKEKELQEKIWINSKSAKDYPEDWLVIPALEVIGILENLK